MAIVGGSSRHDEVTLDANADTILALTAQEVGLDDQAANTILAGPESGSDATPTYRAAVADDIPDLSSAYEAVDATIIRGDPATHITDADTAHDVASPAVDAALDAMGTTINSVLAALEAIGIVASE
jgi:hypothetical protein